MCSRLRQVSLPLLIFHERCDDDDESLMCSMMCADVDEDDDNNNDGIKIYHKRGVESFSSASFLMIKK